MRLKFIARKFTVFIQNVQDVKKIISFIKNNFLRNSFQRRNNKQVIQ